MVLLYQSHGYLQFQGYSIVDWARSLDDCRSTSGYYIFLGSNLVFRSKKQNIVAQSSAKAEYRGMGIIACEFLWLKQPLIELGFIHLKAMVISCDNHVAIRVAFDPIFHEKTKHIKVDCHSNHHHVSSSIHFNPICEV